jgi:ABC-type Fe3+-siderophore transport system permease subunit
MRLQTLQIAAGLGAAVAFVLAFMAAGALIASALFALIGAGLIGWIVYGLARDRLTRPPAEGRLSHGRHPSV